MKTQNSVNAYKHSMQTHTPTHTRRAILFDFYTDFLSFPIHLSSLDLNFYQFNNQFMPTHNLNLI